jgi:hypothetical protein
MIETPVKPEGIAIFAEPSTTPELLDKSLVIVIVYDLVSPVVAVVGDIVALKYLTDGGGSKNVVVAVLVPSVAVTVYVPSIPSNLYSAVKLPNSSVVA